MITTRKYLTAVIASIAITFSSLAVAQGEAPRQTLFTNVQIFDGVSEARNKSQQEYGEERFKKLFFKHKDLKAEKLLDSLKGDLFAFTKGAPQHDDITYILVEA